MNLYEFVHNDSLNRFDAFGLEDDPNLGKEVLGAIKEAYRMAKQKWLEVDPQNWTTG